MLPAFAPFRQAQARSGASEPLSAASGDVGYAVISVMPLEIVPGTATFAACAPPGCDAVEDPARQLIAGVWGIRQPRPDLGPEVPASQPEFVLVPGVAFTRRCERLGYGLQVIPDLTKPETDQRVDLVVTEDAEYRRSG